MSAGSRRLVVRGGKVLLPDDSFVQADVMLADGRIESIGRGGSTAPDAEVLDATGLTVLPGLIDLHTHGIGRESMASSTLEEYARIEAEKGATTFYPTLFGPPEESARAMERHRGASGGLHTLPQVGGFRLESPYLARTGAGVSRDLGPIREETTERLLAAGGGLVKIWDVSPELEGAPRLIRRLTEAGIVCSMAHTQASIEQARAAVDAGARLVTHLFDTFVQPAMVDAGVYPAGLVDYLLVEDRVTCEIIGDGTHVALLLVEKTLRCKTPDRVAWITDSNFGAGLPSGEYDAPGWGWIRVDGPNSGARLRDRGMVLAGSALTPIDGLRNAVRMFGRDLATASRLCSRTPARLMGLRKGEIAVGLDADLIAVDNDLTLAATVAAGRIVYRR
jgi:N-acetylglucosamine-6-phosphate deacetylase